MAGKAKNLIRLSEVTTFRLGGQPVHYVRPSVEAELRRALGFFRRRHIPFYVLGGGSNLLVDDGHLPFGVIHIRAPGFNWIEQRDQCRLRVGAGTSLARLLNRCRSQGLGGLEFLAGVPGTIGGAVAGNAGAWGHAVGQRLTGVTVFDAQARRRRLNGQQVRTGYRSGPLEDGIITEVELLLEVRDRALIGRRMNRCIRLKRQQQPIKHSSAGCVFKNPPGASAGKLLDICGMKGARAGEAAVSSVHANFIINHGAATARDVLVLIDRMRSAVLSRFGVELELEIHHWSGGRKVA